LTPTRLVVVVAMVLLFASPGRADVGLIINEPVDALGFFTRVGHAAVYLSHICPDGSPVKMRLCRRGEHGSVVSKFAPLSEREDYDWAIVPFEAFMLGMADADLAPIIGTRGLQRAIEQFEFGPLFSAALTADADGELPEGKWKAALATRFDRTLYIYSVATTAADDAALVAAFNAAPNTSRFNFFYRNCSDQARAIFDLILPNVETIDGRIGGVTMQTPKGLAKALVAQALNHPELRLQVHRYPQLPGTYRRSTSLLFPMENTYKSVAFMPWWFFGGFRIVALGAMFYHEVISPFSVQDSSRDFMSPLAAQLTLEQSQLRQQQDDIRAALALAESRNSGWSTLSEHDARISRRLAEIRAQKQAEVTRREGARERWRELGQGFQTLIQPIGRRPDVPGVLKKRLARYAADGTLSKQVLDYLDANGQFFIATEGRGPWILLPLAGGELASTGLSTSHILSGDPRVAALVLAAVLDYNLSQSQGRREDIRTVEEIFALFWQATDRIGRLPEGQ